MHDIIIFIAGAIAGAIINRYSDKCLYLLEKSIAVRFLRRKRKELMSDFIGKNFSIADISSSVFIASYAPDGFRSKNIRTKLCSDMDYELNTKHKADEVLLNKMTTHWKNELDEQRIFNGRNYALVSYDFPRHEFNEELGLRLNFLNNDYVNQRIRTSLYHSLDKNTQNLILNDTKDLVDKYYSTTFGVSLAVITHDDRMVFVNRGQLTAVNSGTVVCGVVEGMDERDLSSEGNPDPYMTAYRGLKEELGIELSTEQYDAVKLNAFILNIDYYEWGMIGIADFRDRRYSEFTSAFLIEQWKLGKGKDKYEVNGFDSVDFEPKAVAKYIEEKKSKIVNYAFVATIYALLNDFSRNQVDSAFSSLGQLYIGVSDTKELLPDLKKQKN